MKKWIILLCLFVLSLNQANAQSNQTDSLAFPYIYSVKYICGLQSKPISPNNPFPMEPPVKPGNYATVINIHNYHVNQAKTFKKAVIANGQIGGISSQIMLANQAIAIDCTDIVRMLKPPYPPFIEGFVEFGSTHQLSVVAVYTSRTCFNPGTDQACSQLGEVSLEVVPQQAFLDQ